MSIKSPKILLKYPFPGFIASSYNSIGLMRTGNLYKITQRSDPGDSDKLKPLLYVIIPSEDLKDSLQLDSKLKNVVLGYVLDFLKLLHLTQSSVEQTKNAKLTCVCSRLAYCVRGKHLFSHWQLEKDLFWNWNTAVIQEVTWHFQVYTCDTVRQR